MIISFKHKELEKYYKTGSTVGIQSNHTKRLRLMLSALDTTLDIDDINIPGFRLHQLKGVRDETWSISVSGNWRLTFKFTDGNGNVLNYEDYH